MGSLTLADHQRFASLLVLFCVALTAADSGIRTQKELWKSDTENENHDKLADKPLVANYDEIRETLKNIFAHGVYAEKTDRDFNILKTQRDFTGLNPWQEKRDGQRSLHMDTEEGPIDMARDYGPYRAGSEVPGLRGVDGSSSFYHYHPNSHHAGGEHATEYLNEWIVHVPGGPKLAATLAQDLGYHFHGQVRG